MWHEMLAIRSFVRHEAARLGRSQYLYLCDQVKYNITGYGDDVVSQ